MDSKQANKIANVVYKMLCLIANYAKSMLFLKTVIIVLQFLILFHIFPSLKSETYDRKSQDI